MAVLWALVVALAALGLWRLSVHMFPWRTCPRCHGERRIRDGAGHHRDCARCGASGRVRRIGARKE